MDVSTKCDEVAGDFSVTAVLPDFAEGMFKASGLMSALHLYLLRSIST